MYNQTLISSAQSKLLSKPLSNIKVKVSEILLTFKLLQLFTIFEININHTGLLKGQVFPLNGITKLVNPPKNIFGLAQLQLLFYF